MTLLPRPPVLLAVAALAGCAGSPTRDTAPGPAPATAGRDAPAGHARAPAAAAGDEADARFMQHMIEHHAQALTMTDLVPQRTTRPEVRLIAERIAVSQRDEIGQMGRWLRAHGRAAPESTAARGHGDHAGMPGMLSTQEMAQLAAARGPEFDRLFLEKMIRHHEGAITMVRELFSSPQGGQASDVYRLAADVEADQRMEIGRMRQVLAMLSAAQPR